MARFGRATSRAHGRSEVTIRRRWSDLSDRSRRFLVIAGVAEGILKLAALVDLKRRPAEQIRGPKWVWASSLVIVGSAGVLPIFYFLIGRRRRR